jgi:hypothetical protein
LKWGFGRSTDLHIKSHFITFHHLCPSSARSKHTDRVDPKTLSRYTSFAYGRSIVYETPKKWYCFIYLNRNITFFRCGLRSSPLIG